MRQQRGWAWVVVVCVFCVANVLAEQSGAVPRLVKFSGELKDSLGQPLTGAVDATFSIYKEETDASPIWWETQTVQADSQGRYTVLLGATRSEGLPIELFTSGEGRWLGVTVGRLPEQARVLLVSVPYAVKAEEAEKLAGKPASAFVVSQDLREMIRQEVRRQIRESQASSAVQPQAAQGSGAIASKAANSVASPPGKRQQQGPTDFVGNTADALVTMTNGTGDPLRVWGWEGMEATAVGPFSSAVVGKSVSGAGLAGSSDRGPGVLGATKDGTAAVEGTSSGNLVTAVLGTASGSGGIGVYGQSLASSGTTLGVMGVVQSPGGKAGVFANTAGGTILQGNGASLTPVFTVGGTGDVSIAGNLNAAKGIVASSDASGSTAALQSAIFGTATGSWAAGVMGISTSNYSFGVYGEASAPQTAAGVFINTGGGDLLGAGTSFSECLNRCTFGVSSAGNVHTTGSLEIGGGASFGGGLNVSQGLNVGGMLSGPSGLPGGSGPLNVSGDVDMLANLRVNGSLNVSGNLSKGGGSFKIDHPLDPANKYLSHSFVESPDMMNIYNGNVILDAHGEAVIQLPNWFEALNRDFRYQLTAIGAPGPNLYVAEEVANNHFKIAGGKRGMRVSWQVTGIRQDAWANAHRIRVEEEKPVVERGYYLHPELFGAPQESGIQARRRGFEKERLKEVEPMRASR